jgi:hypothetical protein
VSIWNLATVFLSEKWLSETFCLSLYPFQKVIDPLNSAEYLAFACFSSCPAGAERLVALKSSDMSKLIM